MNYTDPTGHMVACDKDDWACQTHWDDPVVEVEPYTPDTLDAVIETVATTLFEPLDWMNMADLCLHDQCSPWFLLALAPLIPGSIGKYGDEVVEGGAHFIDDLPDNALVCRGGTCTADRFAGGSGVTVNPDGTLSGVSVNSAPGASFDDLTTTIPNRQVGVTTVGDVRAAGGNVVRSPTASNPFHSTLSGITPSRAERLFTPTRFNPHRFLP